MSISIKEQTNDVFVVTVAGKATTAHEVTVTDKMLRDLTNDRTGKTRLLEFSLKFLLDREPNTSILSSFEITVISQYFPDFTKEVIRWCVLGYLSVVSLA